MNKFFIATLGFAIAATTVYADCASNRKDWLKQHRKCIAEFQKVTQPENQPKTGMFEVKGNDYEACLQLEKENFSDFLPGGDCETFVDKKLEEKAAVYQKKCFHRSSMMECETQIGDSKIDAIRDPEGATLLMRAAREADMKAFDFMIEHGADINKTDNEGKNALFYAISARTSQYVIEESEILAMVKKVLELGLHPQMLDMRGRSALIYAMERGCSHEILQLLIDNGANVNLGVTNDENVSHPALSVALQNMDEPLVDLLLKNGANPNNESFSMWYPLVQDLFVKLIQSNSSESDDGSENYWSENDDRSKFIIKLLGAKLDPNGSVFFGDTLHSVFVLALLTNAPDAVINAFLAAKVDMNKLYWFNQEPFNPVQIAIENNKLELLKYLIKNKFDMNKTVATLKNGGQLNALDLAVFNKNLEAVKLIVKTKINVNRPIVTDNYGTETALCLAISREDNVAVIKTLLAAKANPNVSCLNDGTPLLWAIQNLDVETVKALINSKANVNAKFGDNSSSHLEYAESQGNAEIIKLLKSAGARKPFRGDFVQYCLNPDLNEKMVLDAISEGADINEVETNQGWTPLHSIAQNGKDIKAMGVLIKRGAFVNATTRSGYTPFLSAARHNPDPAFLKMLIAGGADMQAKDSDGWNALMVAVAHNSPSVVSMLLQTELGEDLSDSDKNQLIRIAIRNNPNEKVLIALFKAGFKVDPENSWNERPLHTALDNKASLNIIKTLLQAHALVDDRTMRMARDLPMDNPDELKYRNAVIDALTRARKKQK